ncbi:hypothetical protein ACF1CG_06170 [Streptomyces sp. NPDC014773]|uniref:hypothetical protein n=1 Tax=Streptomyces sp. NPDC014773 TaxID=3364908 RepID=UPI0037008A00
MVRGHRREEGQAVGRVRAGGGVGEPVVGNSREPAAAIGGSSYGETDAGRVVFFEEEDGFVRTVPDFTDA